MPVVASGWIIFQAIWVNAPNESGLLSLAPSGQSEPVGVSKRLDSGEPNGKLVTYGSRAIGDMTVEAKVIVTIGAKTAHDEGEEPAGAKF